MGSPFHIAFLMATLIIFQILTDSLVGQSASGRYRDCSALAGYNGHYASEPGIRGTLFIAIPQSIKLLK